MTGAAPSSKHLDDVVDAALLALPVNDRGATEFTPIKIDMDREGENHSPDADVNLAVPDGVAWHFFDQCRKSACRHPVPPRSNTTEQGNNGRAKLSKGNPVTGIIDGSLAALRQTEEQLRLVSAVTRLPGATS